jgi:hypothetical protein
MHNPLQMAYSLSRTGEPEPGDIVTQRQPRTNEKRDRGIIREEYRDPDQNDPYRGQGEA